MLTKDRHQNSRFEIFAAALRLGCTSFGGPVAHLGYFHAEYVQRRQWLSEEVYADLVALCQFLPGPASSQLGIAIGLLRGGPAGGFLAWVGFTLPSAVAMIVGGYGMAALGDVSQAGWLRGLKLAALAVVAQAVWMMARKLCTSLSLGAVALVASALALAFPGVAWAQAAILAAGGLFGWRFLREGPGTSSPAQIAGVSVPDFGRRGALLSLAVFGALLVGLPWWREVSQSPVVAVVDSFYRTGSLVFGGGHVVLALLQNETVAPGWVGRDRFLAGYGLVQAVPGPLFTFAAYLGTVLRAPEPHGWKGGLLCLGAIFLPSGLLVAGVLPFWETLRRRPAARAILRGANSAVVGLLLAALYRPVWTSAVHNLGDVTVALAAFGLLALWRCPPWLVVGLAAGAGQLLL